MTPNYVGIIERGTKLPTLITLAALAKALGISPAELIAEPRSPDAWIDDMTTVAVTIPERRRALALALLRTLADPSAD